MNRILPQVRSVALTLLPLLFTASVLWFQWNVWPGHDWLQGETQRYVPVLERLLAPGMLSRDLVAAHPDLTYTAYDEITLSLVKLRGVPLKKAVEIQQIVFAAAALLGVFLLARCARLPHSLALAIAAVVTSSGYLLGPNLAWTQAGPDPSTFAWGAVLLAAGLFAKRSPLLGGVAGGVALLYDLRIALPFWCVIISAGVLERTFRRLLLASLPVLAVFALLLGNLAQLQPAVAETQELWSRTPFAIAMIQRFRSPELWVTAWRLPQVLAIVAWVACCAWGVARLWGRFDRAQRWLFLGLPVAGLASIPVSSILLDWLRWSPMAQFQPIRNFGWVLIFGLITCVGAAWTQFRLGGRRLEAAALVFAGAGLLCLRFLPADYTPEPGIAALADWAQDNTWGASMFLFPDAAQAGYPGRFRAETLRPVWVDWQTGSEVNSSDVFAREWYQRWRETMKRGYTVQALRSSLALPIDYYVLQRRHAVAGIPTVYSDPQWVVYDAQDLKRAAR